MTGKRPQGVRSQCRSWEDKDSLSKFVQLTMNGTSEIQRLILGRHVLDDYVPAMEKIPRWGRKKAPDF